MVSGVYPYCGVTRLQIRLNDPQLYRPMSVILCADWMSKIGSALRGCEVHTIQCNKLERSNPTLCATCPWLQLGRGAVDVEHDSSASPHHQPPMSGSVTSSRVAGRYATDRQPRVKASVVRGKALIISF